MNELYKNITGDVSSFIIFMALFVLIGFSTAILIASVGKTIIDYYFARQLQYLKTLAGLTVQQVVEQETPNDKN